MEEKDKLLKKLKEVVGKYKQLQTHARALKGKLEEQEKISESNDEALNLAGKFGTNLVEEKEQLNEQVKQLKDIVRSNAEELRKSRSKEEKYEDLLKEVEQKNSTLSEANVQVETKLHQMREEIQSLKSNNAKLNVELGESENKVALLSSSVQASSPMEKVRSIEKKYQDEILRLQEQINGNATDVAAFEKLQAN